MTAAYHRVTCADTASHFPYNGEANFPEFHNVYIDPCSYAAYKKTSVFPEGTIFFKKLQLTLPGQNSDGSRTEPSGRGYFPGRWKWLPSPGPRRLGELNDRDCCISFPFAGIIGASHQT
jgi:Cytochrome P460